MTTYNNSSSEFVAAALDTATIVSDQTTRYFLIKSYNNDNIGRSLQYGVWATSQRNERVLSGAYQTSAYVVLVFSVNHSSRFSGFGVMTSEPGKSSCQGKHVFCGPDGTPFPGKMFSVHWVTNCEVFFRDCEDIINTFNENKPVKVGRDGQEIDPVAGRRLCLLIDSKQPRHSRPAPLLLDASEPTTTPRSAAGATLGQHKSNQLPHLDTTTTSDTSSTLQIDASSKTLQQLALVAKFLKKNDDKPIEVNVEKPCIEMEKQKKQLKRDEGTTVCWDLNWIEDFITRQPVLHVFPIDLTGISSYDAYVKIYQNAKDKWEELQRSYSHEALPKLPTSIRCSEADSKNFNAEFLLQLFARSVSQEELDEYVRPYYHTNSMSRNIGNIGLAIQQQHLPHGTECVSTSTSLQQQTFSMTSLPPTEGILVPSRTINEAGFPSRPVRSPCSPHNAVFSPSSHGAFLFTKQSPILHSAAPYYDPMPIPVPLFASSPYWNEYSMGIMPSLPRSAHNTRLYEENSVPCSTPAVPHSSGLHIENSYDINSNPPKQRIHSSVSSSRQKRDRGEYDQRSRASCSPSNNGCDQSPIYFSKIAENTEETGQCYHHAQDDEVTDTVKYLERSVWATKNSPTKDENTKNDVHRKITSDEKRRHHSKRESSSCRTYSDNNGKRCSNSDINRHLDHRFSKITSAGNNSNSKRRNSKIRRRQEHMSSRYTAENYQIGNSQQNSELKSLSDTDSRHQRYYRLTCYD